MDAKQAVEVAPAQQPAAEEFEALFAKVAECVELITSKQKEIKTHLKKLKSLHSAEVKAALKQKPPKKKKEVHNMVSAPVPERIRTYFKCKETELPRTGLSKFIFAYLKEHCGTPVKKDIGDGKRPQNCYVADKAASKVFGIKEGDLIEFCKVNQLMKQVCEADATYVAFKKNQEEQKSKSGRSKKAAPVVAAADAEEKEIEIEVEDEPVPVVAAPKRRVKKSA